MRAEDLLESLRAELAPVEEAIRSHRFLDSLAAGAVPRERLRAIAGEQRRIIASDRRSFAQLAARFPSPPAGDWFLSMAVGEGEALALLDGYAAWLAIDEDWLREYAPDPRAQSYPTFVARCRFVQLRAARRAGSRRRCAAVVSGLEVAWSYEADELCAASLDVAPARAREHERRERRGRELGLELAPPGRRSGEVERELLDCRVVSDEHHRGDVIRHAVQALEQHVGARAVELGLVSYGHRPERRLKPLERFACAPRGRAQHELGRDVMLAQVARDRAGGAPAPARERPFVIGQLGLLPAGLRVAQQVETLAHARRGGCPWARLDIGSRERKLRSVPLKGGGCRWA